MSRYHLLPGEANLIERFPSIFKSDEDVVFRFRYPVLFPLLAAGYGLGLGVMQSERARLWNKPQARMIIRRNVVGYVGTQLVFSAFVLGARWLFATDSPVARGVSGAAAGYALSKFMHDYALGFRRIPVYAVVSIAMLYGEQDFDYVQYWRRFRKNEQQRIRALMLLDPKRPDYEELREELEATVRRK